MVGEPWDIHDLNWEFGDMGDLQHKINDYQFTIKQNIGILLCEAIEEVYKKTGEKPRVIRMSLDAFYQLKLDSRNFVLQGEKQLRFRGVPVEVGEFDDKKVSFKIYAQQHYDWEYRSVDYDKD